MRFKSFYIALIIAVLCGRLSFAQSPTLGAATGFVLFSSTGAVGNSGTTSQFTGNIGTVSGAITIGVNVNGVLHSADASTTAAAAAISNAYQQLQATPPTDTQLTGASYSLGNGDTLLAGVDSIDMNTGLNGMLYLDGQNNANTVFIFKIKGTFSTAANAKITLINGALACNVFWQVKGMISTASNTILRGTFIAENAAISLGAGTQLDGRAFTETAGAITANSVLAKVPAACGSGVLTGPPAPALGTAACYTLFTSDGANTNAGTTYSTGDVGTNSGLTTGYSALLVNGMIHPVPDASTGAAASNLSAVYTNLSGLTPNIELLYPALLGHSLVLTPHTYLLNAATSLTDTLYLNAEGNADAVFVLKVNGALATSTHAAIILTNGTQAKNVFWLVEGAITMNDYSILKGTFIANNGAISLTTGVQLVGRALSTTGALSAASDSVTIPPNTCAVALPLRWLSFTGKPAGQSVLLNWTTAHEVNNSYFVIEKSSDAINFSIIARVDAADAANIGENHYSLVDAMPYSLSYYRISQTDRDGQRSVYKTIQVDAKHVGEQQTIAYLQDSYIFVRYAAGNDAADGSLVLYGMDGRKMSAQPIVKAKEDNLYQLEKPGIPGIYLIYIEKSGVKQFATRIMVN